LKIGEKKLINENPRLGYAISYLWKLTKSIYFNFKWRITRLSGILKGYYGIHFDIDRIYWIDPKLIEFCSQAEFSVRDFKGRVIGGDWDQTQKRFNDLDIYIAL
jgi:hypothetical protein